MKRWLVHLILAVVVMLLVASGLLAQEFSDIELNLYASANAHTKSDFQIGFPQATPPIPGEFRLNDSLGGGVRFNVNTTRHWGEEFLYSLEPNRVHLTNADPLVPNLVLPVRVHNIAANALFYFSGDHTQALQPFLTFGAGAAIFQPTSAAETYANDLYPFGANLPGFKTSAEFAFNAGIGYKLRLGNNAGFRMDVRGFINRNPNFGLPRSSPSLNATVLPTTGSMETLEASAGFYFKFKN
jgi:hypothetical protein